MSLVKNPLPPVSELRKRFRADFETGQLFIHEDCPYDTGRTALGGKAGSYAGGRYRVCINGRLYPAPRILWALHTGRDPGPCVIDHIDGDTLNNSISNLRAVTPSENRMNCVHHSSSGSKGIHHYVTRKGEDRWNVQLCRVTGRGPVGEKGSRDGKTRKTYAFGTFRSLAEAKARYAEVVREWGLEGWTREQYLNPTSEVQPEALRNLPDQCDNATLDAFLDYVGGAK